MLKVTVVGPSFGAGNDPLYWGKVFSELGAKGVKVTAYSYNSLPPEIGSVKYKRVRPLRLGMPCNAYRTLCSVLHEPADVVIVNEFSILSSLVLLASKMVSRTTPIILLVENDPKFLLRYGVDRTSGVHKMFRSILARSASVTLTNNALGANYLCQQLGVDPARVLSNPYLTSEQICNQPRRAPDGNISILSIGQLIERKGFARVLNELTGLSLHIRAKFKWFVYGEGPARRELEAMSERFGLTEMVSFCGNIPYEQMAFKLREADLFLDSSLADYRSLVAFEALSAGLPIICSKYDGACGEVVTHNENGWIYDPDSPGTLTRILETIGSCNISLVEFSRASEIKALHFTVEKAAKALLDGINAAIAS